MDKFIRFEVFDHIEGQKYYRVVNLNHVVSFKVSEKLNKIVFRTVDGSVFIAEKFDDNSKFKEFEKELLSKIEHLYPKETIRF